MHNGMVDSAYEASGGRREEGEKRRVVIFARQFPAISSA